MTIKDYSAPIVPGGSFTWGEYALLREWNTYAIPLPSEMMSAVFLFTKIEKLIRQPLGKPIAITSGARTSAYTAHLRARGIPAALGSAHNTWEAVDLKAPNGMTNSEFWSFCNGVWPGRMEALSATPSWVHIDTRLWGKRQRFKP